MESNQPATESPSERSSGCVGKLVFLGLLLFVGSAAFLGYQLMSPGTPPTTPTNTPPAASGQPANGSPAASNGGKSNAENPKPRANPNPASRVEINIACGTEKKLWMKWAIEQFEQSNPGRGIKVNLYDRGSVEGAHDVLNGPKPVPFHVWSPASSVYRDVFESEWGIKHATSSSPIIRSEDLALTPMVFVMWKERFEGFKKKYATPPFAASAKPCRNPPAGQASATSPSGDSSSSLTRTPFSPTAAWSPLC